MSEMWIPLAVLAAWFVLNVWVLPMFGVET